jgi:hypothetical protein
MTPRDVLPTFFFSYAWRDGDKDPRVRQFFKDLEGALVERTLNVPDGKRLGTYDHRINSGRDWDDELSYGLSKNKALVAMMTLPYFGRENCGKEVAIFARRHPGVEVDRDGCLRHSTNILPIRWLEETAYTRNGVKNDKVPGVLRKVNWTPADDGRRDRVDAIRRYREKGMKVCVKPRRGYYDELLRAFAESIIAMPDLPEASFSVAWNDIKSAFDEGWATGWTTVTEPEVEVRPDAAVPAGPGDVVVFYMTAQPLLPDPRPVPFADRLVDVSVQRGAAALPAPLLALFGALEQAMQAEHLNDFHCAADPQIPSDPKKLIDQLAALSNRKVLVAAIVEPAVWLGAAGGEIRDGSLARDVLDQVMKSERWGGPVLLPTLTEADRARHVTARLAALELARVAVVLPEDPSAMVERLQSILVQERGRIMQVNPGPEEAERPPLLRGPGSEKR